MLLLDKGTLAAAMSCHGKLGRQSNIPLDNGTQLVRVQQEVESAGFAHFASQPAQLADV